MDRQTWAEGIGGCGLCLINSGSAWLPLVNPDRVDLVNGLLNSGVPQGKTDLEMIIRRSCFRMAGRQLTGQRICSFRRAGDGNRSSFLRAMTTCTTGLRRKSTAHGTGECCSSANDKKRMIFTDPRIPRRVKSFTNILIMNRQGQRDRRLFRQ